MKSVTDMSIRIATALLIVAMIACATTTSNKSNRTLASVTNVTPASIIEKVEWVNPPTVVPWPKNGNEAWARFKNANPGLTKNSFKASDKESPHYTCASFFPPPDADSAGGVVDLQFGFEDKGFKVYGSENLSIIQQTFLKGAKHRYLISLAGLNYELREERESGFPIIGVSNFKDGTIVRLIVCRSDAPSDEG